MEALEAAGCTKREAYNGRRSFSTDVVFVREDYAIAELENFRTNIEKTRTTSNMLNPNSKEWEIPVNTPAGCDPGTETYHCM